MLFARIPCLAFVPIWAFTIVGAAVVAGAEDGVSKLTFGGDLRVRYEANSSGEGVPKLHKGVLRFRLAGIYRINPQLEVGARLVTGNPDNPRTNDVVIGDFLENPELSFDMAYIAAKSARARVVGGRFVNPFATTELVWDGDFRPTGFAGSLETGRFAGFDTGAAAIFMLADEPAVESSSTMCGAQFRLARPIASGWGFEVGAAYWDYNIPGLARSLETNRYRGNYLASDGASYLSDFNLADLTVVLAQTGGSRDYPVRLVADYVKNLGARVDEDQGFLADLYIGNPWIPRRFIYHYGFAQCESDAVLGAFSSDNIPLATNYRSHTIGAAYGLFKDTSLSLTWYYFRQLHADSPRSVVDAGAYRSRVRLDLMVRF